MDFNREGFPIFNNKKIEKREKADKLFVVTKKTDGCEYELWVSSRMGDNKKWSNLFQKNWIGGLMFLIRNFCLFIS